MTTGFDLTVMEVEVVPVHPYIFVTVTLYEVVTVGLIEMVRVVAPFDQ